MQSRRKYSTTAWVSTIVVLAAVLVSLGFAVGLNPAAPKEDRIKLGKWLKAATFEAAATFTPAQGESAEASGGNSSGPFAGLSADYGNAGTVAIELPREIREAAAKDNSDIHVSIFPTLIPGSDMQGSAGEDGKPQLPLTKNIEKACFTSNGLTVAASALAADGKGVVEAPVEILPELGLLAEKFNKTGEDGTVQPSVICIRYEVKAGDAIARGILPQLFHPELSFADKAVLKYRISVVRPFHLNFIHKERWRYLTSGLTITLEVALCAVIIGIILGFLVAVIRSTHDKHGRLRILNAVANIYLTVIRGTPMTVQLLIAYYVIFASSNNGVLVAILAFGFNSGAYVAEIMRAGITSIDDGQMEAGRSLGLSYVQTLRFIILPQAVRNVLPALGNEFIVLLKDTSIASFIALRDLSKGGEIIRSQTYDAFMPFLMVAAIYLVLVMFFTWLLGKLERRLHSTAAKEN